MTRKRRVFSVLGYLVFLAFLFEGFARLVFSIPEISKRLRANEDYTNRREWVQKHQKTATEVYYTFDMYDPSKGWKPKPNLRDVRVFDNRILNTNSKGLRGKKDFPYSKDKQRLRILILGDSFTFGDEVSDNETYSHYLQQMLPHSEIINMGVHGYGHDQMLILLREEGVKYEPDIVMVGFLPLDMPRNVLEFRDFAKPRFVLTGGQLKLTGTPVPRPEDILQSDWRRPRIVDLSSYIYYKATRLLGFRDREIKDVTGAILTEMIKSIDSIHAIPILAYLPRARETVMDLGMTDGEAYMFSVCRLNQKAKCFSARPYFAEHLAKGEAFKPGGHWDAAGHLVVAEAIKSYLVTEGYVNLP